MGPKVFQAVENGEEFVPQIAQCTRLTRPVVLNRGQFCFFGVFVSTKRSALNILQCTGLPPPQNPELEEPLGRLGEGAEGGTKMNSQRQEGAAVGGWLFENYILFGQLYTQSACRCTVSSHS